MTERQMSLLTEHADSLEMFDVGESGDDRRYKCAREIQAAISAVLDDLYKASKELSLAREALIAGPDSTAYKNWRYYYDRVADVKTVGEEE